MSDETPLLAPDALRALEERVETAVMRRDIDFLDATYAGDFRLTHSTGRVDTREAWLAMVSAGVFHERTIVEFDVEPHGDVALTTGSLRVVREGQDGMLRYTVRYVRVYALRDGRARLLSHRSIELRYDRASDGR